MVADRDRSDILDRLRTVLDPELGVNIVDLGLVYEVDLEPGLSGKDDRVRVVMTLTSPGCPLQHYISSGVRSALGELGLEAEVEIVWSPAWHPGRMNDEARRQMGWVR